MQRVNGDAVSGGEAIASVQLNPHVLKKECACHVLVLTHQKHGVDEPGTFMSACFHLATLSHLRCILCVDGP